ncbi:hypothetical protein AAB26_24075 [Salmonella enterica subsp. houtenae]|nr:hypothetical protein [Salmonella enterica subsp. houtenae]EAN3151389.1 hypothetical protein [Salmonella enterica]EAQ6169396.1 hypothetical protein [Salmonella enterica]EAU3067185.1 hypothetical protein [Salmonella enterica]EAV0021667.1 hypothetical protein [Salmonella enterica]
MTHWTGAVFLKSQAGAVLRSRGSKACRQCRPQPVIQRGLTLRFRERQCLQYKSVVRTIRQFNIKA